MQYGVCTGPENAAAMAAVGFDFIELNVQGHLQPRADSAAFKPTLDAIRGSGTSAPAANGFLPANLPVTGPDVDLSAVREYVTTAFLHAQQAGVHTIVFGSGGARQIPDGFDRDIAWQQLVDFGRMIGPLAEQRAVYVVVEHLNRAECNVLTTVPECVNYVREVDHPNVRLLVDAYHVARENEDLSVLDDCGGILRHVHVATYESRKAPGAEDCDLGPFVKKLKEIGYAGRLSIEAQWDADSMSEDAATALKVLRDLVNGNGANT